MTNEQQLVLYLSVGLLSLAAVGVGIAAAWRTNRRHADATSPRQGRAGQARLAMDNVETVLVAAGMTLEDVVRYDVHVTDLGDYFAHGHEHVAKRFAEAGVVPAGGIAAQVSALAVPGMAVEITVVAAR